jgi:pyruvate ferredoxin oxidoreductase beta subunit
MSIITLKEAAQKPDLLTSGHRLCAGCAESIIVRQVLKAADAPTMITSATGCLEVATSIFPYTAWNVPWIHTAFENVAANASGMEAAWKGMRRKKKGPLAKYEDLNIIAIAGDGGTYDIGLQALSGALERGHDFTYLLVDNEAYMNTGIQRSGGTPYAAQTTTSPAGDVIPGKSEWKKPIDEIVIAHEIPYVATISPAWPLDVMRKSQAAFMVKGPAFLHAISPCTRGWRYDPSKTIQIARLAVQTCVFPLYECRREDGRPVYRLSAPSLAIAKRPDSKKPVEEFLGVQGRFRHLFRPTKRDDMLRFYQENVDIRWEILLEKAGLS